MKNALSPARLLLGLGIGLGLGFLTACSGYRPSLNPGGVNGSLGSGNNGSSSIETPTTKFNKLEVAGNVDGGRFDKSQVLSIDKKKKELVVQLPMPANPFLDNTQLTLPLNQLQGATIQVDPIPGGGSALTLHVPLAKLVKGVDFAEPTKLPNGQPIPGVPDGELPSEALRLTNLATIHATIYLGKNVVGAYVNSPINPLLQLGFPIKSPDQTKTWGYLYTYPATTLKGQDGGFFIAVQMPDDIARVIEDAL